jgi:hypothetical protein
MISRDGYTLPLGAREGTKWDGSLCPSERHHAGLTTHDVALRSKVEAQSFWFAEAPPREIFSQGRSLLPSCQAGQGVSRRLQH